MKLVKFDYVTGEPTGSDWYDNYKTAHTNWLQQERLKSQQASLLASDPTIVRLQSVPRMFQMS